MVPSCPECGADLVDLEPGAETGSAAKRYDCMHCASWFQSDASGVLFEVDD